MQWYIAVGKLSSCPKSNATCSTNVSACNEKILDAGITKSICSFILIVVSFLLMVIPSSFCDKVFKTVIRDNVSLAEAPIKGKNIFEYSRNSNGAKDYMALAQEVLKLK